MENNELIIENIGTKISSLILGVIYLFLLIAYVYGYKDNFSEIDLVKIVFYILLLLAAIYMFVNRKIKILLNEDELQIKWKGRCKFYKNKLDDINIVKFNSSRIEFETVNENKVFKISYLRDNEKLKLKKFLVSNLESKYKLA